MASRIYETIYLGSFASLDPTEGTSNTISENASALVGQTFGGAGKPNQLWNGLTNVTINDTNNNGTVTEDPPASAETITYNIGAGVQTVKLDSTQAYLVTITYGPNSGLAPATNINVVIAQDDLGRLFLVPPTTTGATTTALGAGPIQSIVFNSLVTATSSGLAYNRAAVDLLCFAAGTHIITRRGEVPVERLEVGDKVLTRDNGFQTLRMVAMQRVPAEGNHAPVVFAPGTLGNGRELILSPQHRVLVAGAQPEMLFGEPEVLVPAAALVDGVRVTRRSGGMVTYFHLVFDRHEILFAEGAAAESLLVSQNSLARMEPGLRREIETLIPQCSAWQVDEAVIARPCLSMREGLVLRTDPAPVPALRGAMAAGAGRRLA